MKISISTELDASTSQAWFLLQKSSTLVYVTQGLLGFQAIDIFPEKWREGDVFKSRLRLFSLFPIWNHQIKFVHVRENEIRTKEKGGVIQQWDHQIKLTPIETHKTLYSDEVDIKAGLFTPVIVGFAYLFYRYRQRRWQRWIRINQSIISSVQEKIGDSK